MMDRIATRIALVAALVSAGIGLLFTLAARVSVLLPILAAVGVGVAVYMAVQRLVTARLPRINAVLTELRAQAGRGDAGKESGGDEIERVVRKADQTHHAVSKRLSELNRAENYRREYIGDVSHEIKTPIFAIQGFAETLLGGALDDPHVNRGFVEKILHNANRLSALARDLGEISRLETGMLKLARGRFDIAAVFAEVRDSLDLAATEKAIDMRVEVAPNAQVVDGDRDRIRQVLTNLADNAIKYGRPGGWVVLGAEPTHISTRVFIRDNGIGIAPEDLGRVTERFYRVDKSRTREQGGTGLGLSIVKHILAAHRTELEIESEPGGGSTFSFRLPSA